MRTIPSKNPHLRYRVNSFGQIFQKCKPVAVIDTETVLGKYYQFESEDVETKGYIVTCFDKGSFVLIDEQG